MNEGEILHRRLDRLNKLEMSLCECNDKEVRFLIIREMKRLDRTITESLHRDSTNVIPPEKKRRSSIHDVFMKLEDGSYFKRRRVSWYGM